MKKQAWVYVLGVIAVGVALSLLALLASFQIKFDSSDKLLIAILLVALATVGQVGKVSYLSKGTTSSGTSWYTPLLAFLFAGVLVLPPYMLVVLILVPHLAEWAIERVRKTDFLKAWYIQPFNIATHLICGLVAWELYTLVTPLICTSLDDVMCGRLVASVIAGGVYLLMNHYLVGQALVLACGVSWVQSGVLNLKHTAVDAAFMLGGLAISMLLQFTPLVVLPIALAMTYAQRRIAISLVKSPA